jgi:D-xylonolactonase
LAAFELERLSSGHELVEAPIYHPTLGLLVSDVARGGVWRIREGAPAVAVVGHRRGIGGLALHESGGIIVSGRNVAHRAFERATAPTGEVSGTTTPIIERDAANGIVGFNDMTTDARGRLYVGSVSFIAFEEEVSTAKPGHLHMVDLDGTVRTVAEDILLTNGLGFSPDGRKLYHSDSGRQLIRVYDVGDDRGLGAPVIFAETPDGKPDGLAVAEDGTVWLALAFSSAIVVLAPDGRERERIAVPDPMVTSVCFGGADRRDLYVTSGSTGADETTRACVYRSRVDIAGLPRTAARIPLDGHHIRHS